MTEAEPEHSKTNGRGIFNKVIFLIVAAFCLTPFVSPPIALLLGIILAQVIIHPFPAITSRATSILLQVSVVGLGFGMNINSALKAGKQGILFTTASIVITLTVGLLLGRVFSIEKKTSLLISAGTAICGGSAIAAVAPVINADKKQISVSLGTVFILNSIALFLFPVIGHELNLSQTQFGMFCAIAIHDTSSVVGAASKYGNKALEVATTVKLARALWIIPLTFLSAYAFKNKTSRIKIPYFIGLFLLAMVLFTYVPLVQQYSNYVVEAAKAGLRLTLFLIGSGLSYKIIKSVGYKPLLQGVILWLVISATALVTVISVIK